MKSRPRSVDRHCFSCSRALRSSLEALAELCQGGFVPAEAPRALLSATLSAAKQRGRGEMKRQAQKIGLEV